MALRILNFQIKVRVSELEYPGINLFVGQHNNYLGVVTRAFSAHSYLFDHLLDCRNVRHRQLNFGLELAEAFSIYDNNIWPAPAVEIILFSPFDKNLLHCRHRDLLLSSQVSSEIIEDSCALVICCPHEPQHGFPIFVGN